MQMVRRCLSVWQLNSIVTSKIQFIKSNKDILIIGARVKYTLLLFFALFTKMNKNVNYAYQYLSNTETSINHIESKYYDDNTILENRIELISSINTAKKNNN